MRIQSGLYRQGKQPETKLGNTRIYSNEKRVRFQRVNQESLCRKAEEAGYYPVGSGNG